MNVRSQRIVCGVGDAGSPAAVDLAAREAHRRSAELHLVRVVLYPPLDYAGVSNEAPLAVEAVRLVDEARARALAAFPDLVVTHDLADTGWVAGGLTAAAELGSLLVMEQTARGRLRRLVTGSTTDGVAFRTRVPVVVVPHGWDAADAPATVTVAVQDLAEAPQLIRSAFVEAAERSAEVHVLHALWLLGGHDLSAEVQRTWTDRWTTDLTAVLDDLADEHPDVKARVDVVVGPPAEALVAASRATGLLVMGRHHHRSPWGSHLGPVAHRVLLEAASPVLMAVAGEPTTSVVPPAPSPSRGQVAERHDGVAVGIGADGAPGAVAYAAQEARRRDSALHVVRVVPVPPVDAVGLPEAWREDLAEGRRVLTRVAQGLREGAAPPSRLEEHLVEHGPVPQALVEQAEHAAVLVVEHRRLGALRRLVTHSVTNAVVGRRHGPVVAVPAGWTPTDAPGRVVVAVADPDHADHVLDAAIAEAVRRGVPLVVAHSTWVSSDPEGPFLDPALIAGRARRARAALDVAKGLGLAVRPEVEVSTVVEHQAPVDLLEQLVTPDDVLVVEARRHPWARPSHLGPVTRGLLAHVSCPVLLVASSGDRRPPG